MFKTCRRKACRFESDREYQKYNSITLWFTSSSLVEATNIKIKIIRITIMVYITLGNKCIFGVNTLDEAGDLLRMLLNFTSHVHLTLDMDDDSLISNLRRYITNARKNTELDN